MCPHCSRDLRRKYRYNRRCYYCKREFALEPKETILRSHDLRLLKAADALSAHNTLWYTERQLLWRLARNRLSHPMHLWKRMTGKGGAKVTLPTGVSDASVRYQIVDRWAQVYGGPPPGLMLREQADELVRQAAPKEHSVAIVASVDSDVLGCLAANGVPERLDVGLVALGPDGSAPSLLSAEAPVLLLHDASIPGHHLAAWWRDSLGPGRFRDVALTAAQARRAQSLPVLQNEETAVDPALVPDEQDRLWLAQGFQAAVAAMPPARLIGAVGRAVRGLVAGSAKDPDRAAARKVGFV